MKNYLFLAIVTLITVSIVSLAQTSAEFEIGPNKIRLHKQQLSKRTVRIELKTKTAKENELVLLVFDKNVHDKSHKLVGGGRTESVTFMGAEFCCVASAEFEVPTDATYYIYVNNKTDAVQKYKIDLFEKCDECDDGWRVKHLPGL